MVENTECKLAKFAKQHSLSLEWQPLKFGYRRAKFQCGSHDEMAAVKSGLRRISGVSVTGSWTCLTGEFEGYIYAMDQRAKTDYEAKVKEERSRLEHWWARYHVADQETKRLMACGLIS